MFQLSLTAMAQLHQSRTTARQLDLNSHPAQMAMEQ